MINLTLLGQDENLIRLSTQGLGPRPVPAGRPSEFERLCGAGVYACRVLLSLSECHYIDSMCVEWLLKSHRRFQEAGGRLVIHSISPAVVQILKIMRMDLVLSLVENEEQALRVALGERHGR